jgi:type VI secretion system protein ImpG
MRQYFEAEMRLLREAAQAFAKAYPEQARLLNLQTHHDRDPTIERLLEGFAYLTAHLQQRIDDQLPDISANLLLQFWPQILRPYPSVLITQFRYKPGQLQQTLIMPAQTVLKTPALGEEKIVCQFSTVFPVKLQAMQVVSAQTQHIAAGTLLKIHFQCDTCCDINQLNLQDLQIYINAETNLTLNILFALKKQVKSIDIIIPRSQSPQITLHKNNITIKPCYLNPQHSILPNCDRTFSALSLLQDYFCFREKYYFVSISGLDNVPWPPNTKQFIMEIICNVEFKMLSAISEKNLLLNCVPAVNLFKSTSEPIQVNHQRSEYPLIVDATSKKGIQLFSVETIQGLETKSGRQYQYEQVYDFRYLRSKSRCYSLNYRDHGEDLLQPYLIINGVPVTQSEILSCNITVCNGYYPRRFLCELTELHLLNIRSNLTACNITRPTAILYPPKNSEWQWLLISHLSLNYNTLKNVTVLQQLLQNVCWSNYEENLLRISAIRQIDIKPLKKIHKGMLLQGIVLEITIDETGYLSVADIYLFGEVMQQFFSSYAHFNSYVQLKMICSPSQRELIWKVIPGSNPLI